MGQAPFSDLNNSPVLRIARNLRVVKKICVIISKTNTGGLLVYQLNSFFHTTLQFL
jgi:hypothetical protein